MGFHATASAMTRISEARVPFHRAVPPVSVGTRYTASCIAACASVAARRRSRSSGVLTSPKSRTLLLGYFSEAFEFDGARRFGGAKAYRLIGVRCGGVRLLLPFFRFEGREYLVEDAIAGFIPLGLVEIDHFGVEVLDLDGGLGRK